VDVRAASRFAHCVQIKRPKLPLQKVKGLEVCATFSEPLGEARTRARRRLDLDDGTQGRGNTIVTAPRPGLVVAPEEAAQVAARDCAQRIAFVPVVSMLFWR
jgi:hypothetical protein